MTNSETGTQCRAVNYCEFDVKYPYRCNGIPDQSGLCWLHRQCADAHARGIRKVPVRKVPVRKVPVRKVPVEMVGGP